MSLMSEVETVGKLLKTYYESGEVKKQFFNDLVLLNRINQKRKELIGAGGTVTVGLHVGRNPGISAAQNGAQTPTAGKQTYAQTTAALKYLYGATQLTGPDMVNSKTNKGAFANVLTANMTGMLDDMKWDLNRQLFADGSGILCFATDNVTTVTQPIEPFLWAPANKYVDVVGLRYQIRDKSTGATSQLDSDTYATASVVASSTSTTLVSAADVTNTSADGDAIGKYYGIQHIGNTTANLMDQFEVMGLTGIIHDTDLIGAAGYKYDTDNSVTNWTGPEGQSHDWTIASCVNSLQNLPVASNGYWKSKVMGNGGVPRAITFKLLDDMIGHLKVTKGSKLTAMYTTYQVANKIIDLLRADRRYSGEMMTLDGGMKVNSYQGIPIVISEAAPRGQILFVDENELSLYIGKDFGFIEQGGSPVIKTAGYDAYDITGAAYLQLCTHSREKHGKIIDILE